MNIAAAILGLAVAILLAALLHFWRGGDLGKLFFYLVVSVIGFWAGHFLDEFVFKTHLLAVGSLNLGFALLADIVFLGAAYWLGLVREDQKH